MYAQKGLSFTLVCKNKDDDVMWYHNNNPINVDKGSDFVVTGEKKVKV